MNITTQYTIYVIRILVLATYRKRKAMQQEKLAKIIILTRHRHKKALINKSSEKQNP